MITLATLRLFPGIAGTTVRAFCSPPIRGVVLETFGAGNAPQRPDLLEALKEACDRGVVVVAISQCIKGSVSDAYETAQTLRGAGVIPGSDMTPEVGAHASNLSHTAQQSLKVRINETQLSPLQD
jgi:lysophospholipase